MSQKRSVAILLLALLLCLLPTVAAAQSAESLTLEVQAGFDNYYTENQWVPVVVTVSNEGPAIDGYIEVAGVRTGSTTREYRAPAVLPTQSKKQITLYVFPESYISSLTVRLRDNDGTIIKQETQTGIRSLVPGDILYGVVSDDEVNLDVLETVQVELVAGDSHDANVAYLSIDDLPEVAAAWQGLDVLVFSHFDSNQLTPNQRTQIRTWVETGGQLVVMGGVGAKQTAAAFEDLLPVSVRDNVTVDSLASLGQSLEADLAQTGNYLVTDTQLQRGEVLLSNDGQPILVRNAVGSGHVSYIALDSELEPLQNSRVAQALWQQVAVTTGQPVIWELGWLNSWSAEEAARVFPELSPPSVAGLAAFLMLYILAIGPINYFVLKRMERRELAWFTIPAIIVLFLGVAYVTGFRWRGRDVLANQLSVAVGSAESGTVTVDSIIGVYSPRRETYDIAFEDDALVRVGNNNDFRGGSSNSTSRSFIERGSENLVREFRINIADAQSLRVKSYRSAPAIDGSVSLSADSRSIDVSIFNDSDIDIKDATIFVGTHAFELPDLNAGGRIDETIALTVSERRALEAILSPPTGDDAQSSVVALSAASTGSELAVNELVPGERWGFDQSAEDYMRYQFIEAIMPSWYGPGSDSYYIPRNAVAFTGWSDQTYVDMEVKDASSRMTSTTLHIIEIPAEAQ